MDFLTPFPEAWLALGRDAARGNIGLRRLVASMEAGGCPTAAGLDLACLLAMRRPREMGALLDALDPSVRTSTLARLLEVVVASRLEAWVVPVDLLGDLIHQARIDADERTLAWALEEGGRAAGMAGAKVQALEWLEEGIETARRLEMRWVLAMLLAGLGMLHGQDRRSEDYARYTLQGLEVARSVGDEQSVALALCNLGGAWVSMGRLDDAHQAYDDAMTWAEAHDHGRIQALILAGRGGLAFAYGDVAEARAAYQRSAERLGGVGDHFQVARQALLVAQGLQRLGHVVVAVEAFEEGILVARRHGLRHLEATALQDLAECHLSLGDAAAAHEAFRACIRLQQVDIEAQIQAVRVEAQRAQATLLALREAGWERERRIAVEASHRELERSLAEQEELRRELEAVSRTDALTGLANRREFDQRLQFVRSQADRYGRSTSLMLVDVDRFKVVNDTYGHDVGDEVLVEVARRARGGVRDTDLLARWGGEEFAVLLPETDARGALVCAEKLLEAVRMEPFATRAGALAVTVSIGVVTLGPGHDGAQLYRAKRAGRDRVVASE